MSGMKMAKASREDLDAAFALNRAFESLGYGYEPTDDAEDDDGDTSERRFDIDDHESCQRVIEHLRAYANRGSLFRVVMGMEVLLDPRNEMVDPDLDHLEHHPSRVAATGGAVAIAAERARQAEKWGDEHDDEHAQAEMVVHAADLLMHVYKQSLPDALAEVLPDPDDDWGLAKKHPNARDRLVIAGALIAAEIDRRDRAAARQAQDGGA